MRPLESTNVVCLVIAITLSFADGFMWEKENYPSPLNDPGQLCNRKKSISWVCDPDSVLEGNKVGIIEDLLEKIRNKTSSPCSTTKNSSSVNGYPVGVAIVGRISNMKGENLPQKAKQFATYLREVRWTNFSSNAKCDDSVLLFVSKDDKYVYIATGSEVTKRFDKNAMGSVVHKTVYHLKNNNSFEGIRIGVIQIYSYLSGKNSNLSRTENLTPSSTDMETFTFPQWGILLIVMGAICLIIILVQGIRYLLTLRIKDKTGHYMSFEDDFKNYDFGDGELDKVISKQP